MSLSLAEKLVATAREQRAQRDVNDSILKAIGELIRESKRLDDDIHRIRREVKFGRWS